MKKRGEIWWVNFDPSLGQEIKKQRPAVIVSNDRSNKHLRRFQVIPCSSKVSKLYISEVLLNINGKRSKAMSDQLTTVSDLRFVSKIGVVTEEEMTKIEAIIKLQLDLEK